MKKASNEFRKATNREKGGNGTHSAFRTEGPMARRWLLGISSTGTTSPHTSRCARKRGPLYSLSFVAFLNSLEALRTTGQY